MKKHFSVFLFYIRCTFLPFLGLLALMAAVETGLFAFALGRSDLTINRAAQVYADGLETVLASSHIAWAAALFFLLCTVLLSQMGCQYGSKTSYTLCRLSVSEHGVFWYQAAYNICCYLIFWGVQFLLAAAFCLAYTRQAPAEAVSNQTILLAFYRDSFLHGLLPLSEYDHFVMNALLTLGLGMSAAYFPYRNRQGKFSIGIILSAVLTLWLFPRELGSINSFVGILCSILLIAFIVFKVHSKEVAEDALA